jgi:defect-in-organelle-trafficking protein DotC
MGKKWSFIGAFLLTCLVTGCSTSSDANRPSDNKIRIQAVHDAALSYGARYGLQWESERVNAFTQSQTRILDQVYNFNELIMEHNLVPPVVRIADASLHLSNPDSIRLSDRTIEIIHPAHFVTTPPSWRHYLLQNYGDLELPNQSLLPKNEQERAIWDDAIVEGFEQGIKQSKYIYEESTGKITEEYVGMVLFHHLLAQNMISKPKVGQASLGITGNNKKIRINDQLLRITSHSDLNARINEWIPAVSRNLNQD